MPLVRVDLTVKNPTEMSTILRAQGAAMMLYV